MSRSKDSFKTVLDNFLELIPDQPASRDLVPYALTEDCQPTNSLKYWTKTLSLQSWRPPTNHKVCLPESPVLIPTQSYSANRSTEVINSTQADTADPSHFPTQLDLQAAN